MTRHQLRKALASAQAKLAVRVAMKNAARMGTDVAEFDRRCADVRQAEVEIHEIEWTLNGRGRVDSASAELIGSNID